MVFGLLFASGLCNPEKKMLELHQKESCSQSPTLEADDEQNLWVHHRVKLSSEVSGGQVRCSCTFYFLLFYQFEDRQLCFLSWVFFYPFSPYFPIILERAVQDEMKVLLGRLLDATGDNRWTILMRSRDHCSLPQFLNILIFMTFIFETMHLC